MRNSVVELLGDNPLLVLVVVAGMFAGSFTNTPANSGYALYSHILALTSLSYDKSHSLTVANLLDWIETSIA